MGILTKRTPWEREFREVWKQEQKFLRRYETKRESPIGSAVEEIAPETLMRTLHSAFEKAFALVFEKGSGLIQKVSRQENRRQEQQVRRYALDLRENRKNLRAFSKAADRAGRSNVLLSGAAGVGMGLFGIALPDVPLFTAMLLKSVYETAEAFGFPCEGEAERLYALRLIEAALSDGEELAERGRELDAYAQTGQWSRPVTLAVQTKATARKLSEAVLYSKALQSVPVVGAAGGAGDALCLSRVQRYAAIKYRKRFLIDRRAGKALANRL